MAAIGWISVQCLLHIKSMLYKIKPTTKTNSKSRDNQLRNMERMNFEI